MTEDPFQLRLLKTIDFDRSKVAGAKQSLKTNVLFVGVSW